MDSADGDYARFTTSRSRTPSPHRIAARCIIIVESAGSDASITVRA